MNKRSKNLSYECGFVQIEDYINIDYPYKN